MGDYIRVLAKRDTPLSLDELRSCLPDGATVNLELEKAIAGEWSQLILRRRGGSEIAMIEKNPVVAGELGAEEISEFLDEIADAKPTSAATWLKQYLPTIKVIYAFQLLSGTDVDGDWSAHHALRGLIWNRLGGILQADAEGFSNEDGYQITWQFSGAHEGDWKFGLLDGKGRWIRIQLRLEDAQHKAAFLNGEVPPGVKML